MDLKALYKLSYGVFVLTTKAKDQDGGCIINTAILAASSPNQISICVNKANYTHTLLKDAREFNLSVISHLAPFSLFTRFGFQSGREVDKFADFKDLRRSANGIYYVTAGTNAYISVKINQAEDLGSHTMFIGEITDMEVLDDAPSATYDYYLTHIKPAPNPAPKPKEGKTIWRCRICGYEYIGDELPEDFICPVCKHPASDFEIV